MLLFCWFKIYFQIVLTRLYAGCKISFCKIIYANTDGKTQIIQDIANKYSNGPASLDLKSPPIDLIIFFITYYLLKLAKLNL